MYKRECQWQFFTLCVILVSTIILNTVMLQKTLQQYKKLNAIEATLKRLELQDKHFKDSAEKLLRLETQIRELLRFLDPNKAEEYDVTGYAPLDPNAVPGMDYAGDPTITASGSKVIPNVTAAADPCIPFGTKLYIQGIGWRVVQDRGDMVAGRHIDLAMRTRREALEFGRQRLAVIIIKPNSPGLR